jgi:hypothetical protein
MAENVTFLQRFVRDNVCTHKGFVLVPAAPAFMFANPFQFQSFAAAWGLTIILWLILWLAVPCNPNLNCTPTTKKKDGTKALLVSWLIVYGILVVVALAARVFICSSGGPPLNAYGGGVLTQVESLFTMKHLSKGPHPRPIRTTPAPMATTGLFSRAGSGLLAPQPAATTNAMQSSPASGGILSGFRSRFSGLGTAQAGSSGSLGGAFRLPWRK